MTTENANRTEIIDAQLVEKSNPEALRSMRTYSMIVYGLYTLGLVRGFVRMYDGKGTW